MNIILSQNEKELGKWSFVDRANSLEFNNDIIITDKRFIYQKEHSGERTQRSVSRFDVGVENIKGINSFYGVKQSKLWLILGIVGVFLFLLSVLLFVTEEIETGIFMCIVGLVLGIGGFYLHFNPDKSPIKIKKPNFTIKLETKTPQGSVYGLGAGKQVLLQGKLPYNPIVLVLLTMCGVIPGIVYYFVKKSNNADGLDLPEEIAVEVIETLGSLIF